MSDLEKLIEFGFEKERAEMAVKKTGGCDFPFLSSSNTAPLLTTVSQYKELLNGLRRTRIKPQTI